MRLLDGLGAVLAGAVGVSLSVSGVSEFDGTTVAASTGSGLA